VALSLPPWISYWFLDMAKVPLQYTGIHLIYREIINCRYMDHMREINELIEAAGYHKQRKRLIQRARNGALFFTFPIGSFCEPIFDNFSDVVRHFQLISHIYFPHSCLFFPKNEFHSSQNLSITGSFFAPDFHFNSEYPIFNGKKRPF